MLISLLCHVKVILAYSPGQSAWPPHLCRIYIRRSQSNTIDMSLLYHWHIPSMSCQGQPGWFPWSVCLIPTSMSYIHPQKSIKYNICVSDISLIHLLDVMSRSVCLIPLVSLPDTHIYVIYKSTEVHIIQYMCPYYITDTSSLCHVKVSLTDSLRQSAWSPHLCNIYIHRSQSNTIYMSLLYHWHIFSMSCQGQSGWFPWSVALSPHQCHIYINRSPPNTIYVSLLYFSHIPLCHVKVSLANSPSQFVLAKLLSSAKEPPSQRKMCDLDCGKPGQSKPCVSCNLCWRWCHHICVGMDKCPTEDYICPICVALYQ